MDIILLHDAMNVNEGTMPSLVPQQLEFGKLETSNSKSYFPSYDQPILYGGLKLVIQTPAIKMDSLVYHRYPVGDAVLLPISKWLRQQFNIIDKFVQDSVVIPQDLLSKWPYHAYSYKPILEDDNMFLIMKESYVITQETENDIIDLSSDCYPTLGEGIYSFAIEFDKVHIGWHNRGRLYSINYRVTHIHYKPSEPSV